MNIVATTQVPLRLEEVPTGYYLYAITFMYYILLSIIHYTVMGSASLNEKNNSHLWFIKKSAACIKIVSYIIFEL